MIDLLDNLMRQVLMDQIPGLAEAQVRFQPPDQDWRTSVANLGGTALNLYLVDLRENRKLRSNERVRNVEEGVVTQQPAPARVDCHYLVSAWSPAAGGHLVEPTLDEHALLYRAAEVFLRLSSFNPSRVYPAGSLALNAWPAAFRDVDLPAVILPVEGFGKLAEFWSGMGQGSLWRPALYLVVTLPVTFLAEAAGPMVTTRITEYGVAGQIPDVWVQIGGHVFSPARPVAVGDATVTAIAAGGTVVTVDDAGPFRVGDTVSTNNLAQAIILGIAGNTLTLSAALAGLAVGNTLRIASLTPSQQRFRLTDVDGLTAGGTAVIRGEDAGSPGTVITERVEIETVTADGFVTLAAFPVRTRTFNFNVAPANAPTLQEALPGIWVELENSDGERLQMAQTDQAGRFTFGKLRAGHYRLRAQALGLDKTEREIDIPSPTGEYDLHF